MKNKIPKWWYAGFEKGLFYGCKVFIKSWWASSSNPYWDIKRKFERR